MESESKWIPFYRQAFVVLGASVNMAQIHLSLGYTSVLLHQLKLPKSLISDHSASWIASITSITQLFGNIFGGVAMGKYGRRTGSILSASTAVMAWIWLTLAADVTSMLLARSLQGISCGIAFVVSPNVCGEYTSPQNRAVFSSFFALFSGVALFSVHLLGSYYTWPTTALICAIASFLGLLITIYSPESPSWLAERGRHDECIKVFRWLRGNNEENELQKMIEATKQAVPCVSLFKNIVDNCRKLRRMIPCREFYISFISAFHLNTMMSWNGFIILAAFTDLYNEHIIGPEVNFGTQTSLMDFSRIIACAFLIYLSKVSRRKVLLATTVGANCVLLFATAFYAYFKFHKLLPFDHPIIGIVLSHLTIISVSIGASPLPVLISSELFPLRARSFLTAISRIIFSIGGFIMMKSIFTIVKTCGMYGLFLIKGAILTYCLIVTLMIVPETKDRTLQDIEDELRSGSKRHSVEEQVTVPLKSADCD